MLHTHGTTHIDALCHIYVGDTLYNGHPASALLPGGAQRCGVDNVGPIVGRGVLLDMAGARGVEQLGDGEAIEPVELDACAARQGVELRLATSCWCVPAGGGCLGRARRARALLRLRTRPQPSLRALVP